MTRVAIVQSNYIPWKGYFDLIHDADVFCFYDEVQYTKNDWRNRNKIYSKNGLQWLTIPIPKQAVKLKIREVPLPSNWQNDHYKILQFSYGRAPFFNQLKELMDDFYTNTSFRTLSEFNHYTTQRISTYLGITTKFDNSANYSLKSDKTRASCIPAGRSKRHGIHQRPCCKGLFIWARKALPGKRNQAFV